MGENSVLDIGQVILQFSHNGEVELDSIDIKLRGHCQNLQLGHHEKRVGLKNDPSVTPGNEVIL